ncbi:hypothetical protein Phum_PHUM511930 [Pediculus humanus corporis]|uniref:Uncharacterized protein n=1 Tax=Pediculus humanus subsp. corporis TaxID=121224 RepID=E0VY94_PEDHC|nr:uncharacterized protein Phum_PHUM511930 [Pediculus humanus corporis]EEB18350.1 hypothetical protein Phum_PHUM511930 [Pediculus humanus corporis]
MGKCRETDEDEDDDDAAAATFAKMGDLVRGAYLKPKGMPEPSGVSISRGIA